MIQPYEVLPMGDDGDNVQILPVSVIDHRGAENSWYERVFLRPGENGGVAYMKDADGNVVMFQACLN
jgi:hypothetical protein